MRLDFFNFQPMPPPLKLNKEMVEAMESEGWDQFKSYCYEAYINLRRHSQLILSLFGKLYRFLLSISE